MEMKRRMPTTFPFTANGVDYEAVLVEDFPAGGWSTFNEVCSICSQPLGSSPFYTTVPFSFYVHANCAYSNAGRPPSPLDHVVAPSTCLNISGNQTHHASRFVSGPFHPSSNDFYPTAPPAYNPYRSYDPYYYNHLPPNFQYYNHLPDYGYYHKYYSDQFPHANYYYHIQQPPSYATGQFPPAPPHHQHDHHPSSFSLTSSTSSSSSLGWAGLAASTVLGSLLQALFSTMFSS